MKDNLSSYKYAGLINTEQIKLLNTENIAEQPLVHILHNVTPITLTDTTSFAMLLVVATNKILVQCFS